MTYTDRFGEHCRIQIVPIETTKSTGSYLVFFGDELLLERSRNPEYEACRVLAARGHTGKLVSYRGEMPCLVVNDLVWGANRRKPAVDDAEEEGEAT